MAMDMATVMAMDMASEVIQETERVHPETGRRKMQSQRNNRRRHHHHHRRHKNRRQQMVGSILICVCVLAVAAFGIYRQLQSQKSMQVTAGNSHNVGSGYRDIVYNGEKYRYNNRVTTILYAGVDSEGKMEAKVQYGNKARADSIQLVVMDEKNARMSVVSVNRDTITDIRKYALDGTDLGLYKTHIGYAYTYGDGGEVSCQNLCEAVSLLFGGIPINRYVVTNLDSMPYINNLVGGVTVTVPNSDLEEEYPDMYEGAQVTLDDTTITPFLRSRDTEEAFSNDGRMERQRAYATAYMNKVQSMNQSQLEKMWDSMDSMKDYLQTSITRSQYISLVKLIKSSQLTDDSFIQLQGQDKEGELHDEFYADQDALQKLILDLFYEKV
ncbi:LCP family protein [Blautia sp. MSJ-19]|uniref:LCP family protein n=1 Tax=Blautia sp. MSJ-19 TaxID=2841517 RepID=UPI002ED62C7B